MSKTFKSCFLTITLLLIASMAFAGQSGPEEDQAPREPIPPFAPLHGSKYANGQSNRQTDDKGNPRQLQRVAQTLEDDFQNWPV